MITRYQKCQLDMLIFVQVCRTIDKKEQCNQQEGSLCCKKEVLKTSGSKKADVVRSSSPEADVIRGSEDHQKLKDGRTSNVVQVKI